MKRLICWVLGHKEHWRTVEMVRTVLDENGRLAYVPAGTEPRCGCERCGAFFAYGKWRG